jgi:hypothetical protein
LYPEHRFSDADSSTRIRASRQRCRQFDSYQGIASAMPTVRFVSEHRFSDAGSSIHIRASLQRCRQFDSYQGIASAMPTVPEDTKRL